MSVPALPTVRMTRKGFRTLTVTQAKLLLREPAALIWLALPVAMVVIFGNVPAFQTAQKTLGRQERHRRLRPHHRRDGPAVRGLHRAADDDGLLPREGRAAQAVGEPGGPPPGCSPRCSRWSPPWPPWGSC